MKTDKTPEASEEMLSVKEDKGMWWKQAIVLTIFSLILAAVFNHYEFGLGHGWKLKFDEPFIFILAILLFLSALLVFFTWLFKLLTRKIKPFPWIVAAIALLLYPFQFLFIIDGSGLRLWSLGIIWALAELFVCRPQKFKVLPYVIIAICWGLLVCDMYLFPDDISTDVFSLPILSAIPLVALWIVLLLKKLQLINRPTSN